MISMKPLTHSLNWTGNPFVDTGLAVMVAWAESEGLRVAEPSDLTFDVLCQLVNDSSCLADDCYSKAIAMRKIGRRLARRLADANRRLKSYSLVLGSNSPLMNSSTNPELVLSNLKFKVRSDKQKISDIEAKIVEEQSGRNSERKLLQLRNQKDKANSALAAHEKKLIERRDKQASAQQTDSPTPVDSGRQEYLMVIQALLYDLLTGRYSMATSCECTGTFPATLAFSAASRYVRLKMKSTREDFVIGRDWFPLAGSLGNDAQALPAASRAPQISALALLAAQFLPMGALLLNGQLVLFQSTEPSIMQMLVTEIYRETRAKLDSGAEKVEIFGAKSGTTPTALLLIKQFERLQQRRRMDRLPPHTTLSLWLFSNSGTSAKADVIEVPHPALAFLWEAARNHAPELEKFLRNESKVRPENQLLSAIQRGTDYLSFYPFKNTAPASVGLYELYQRSILGRSATVLQTAHWIAARIHALCQSPDAPKDFKQITKLMGDRRSMQKLRPRLKGLFAGWAERGEFSLEEFTRLFPCQKDSSGNCTHPLRTELDGWKLVWFYLNYPDSLTQAGRPEPEKESVMFTHPKVKQFASDVFDYYRQHIGLEKFQKRILDGFRRGQITNDRLQRWFCDLAELGYAGYTCEEWDDLCRDENGNDVTYEVRFQLRLELSNLYAQATHATQINEQKV